MKYYLHWGICLGFVLFGVVQSFSQTNLIVNGDFSSDSGWNDLGQYNGGQATGTIENGSYIITISEPGTELWSVQFTQPHIVLDSGKAYELTYHLSCSINRTVEVSLSRDGGDYISYSGKDTVAVGQQQQEFKLLFNMKMSTDPNARLEFNCGRADGIITIKDVRLVEITDPVLRFEKPVEGEILYEGIPYTITWFTIANNEGIVIELSTDNGETWEVIDSLTQDTGSYIWMPGKIYAPWCRMRVVSLEDPEVYATNDGPFELAPKIELVENGTFSGTAEHWSFDVYEGEASGEITDDSLFHIAIAESANEHWQIQLIQNGIRLEKGKTYLFSFVAFAEEPTTLQVNIGQDQDPFTVYFDTTQWIVAVNDTPQRYSFSLTMNDTSDTNARLEFNCGKAGVDIYFDEISLVPQYKAPIKQVVNKDRVINNHYVASIRLHTGLYKSSNRFQRRSQLCRIRHIYDLKGRALPIRGISGSTRSDAGISVSRRMSTGVYIIKSLNIK